MKLHKTIRGRIYAIEFDDESKQEEKGADMNTIKINLDKLDREELAKVIEYAQNKREKDLNTKDIKIKIKVDTTEIDEALEKIKILKEYREANKVIRNVEYNYEEYCTCGNYGPVKINRVLKGKIYTLDHKELCKMLGISESRTNLFEIKVD